MTPGDEITTEITTAAELLRAAGWGVEPPEPIADISVHGGESWWTKAQRHARPAHRVDIGEGASVDAWSLSIESIVVLEFANHTTGEIRCLRMERDEAAAVLDAIGSALAEVDQAEARTA